MAYEWTQPAQAPGSSFERLRDPQQDPPWLSAGMKPLDSGPVRQGFGPALETPVEQRSQKRLADTIKLRQSRQEQIQGGLLAGKTDTDLKPREIAEAEERIYDITQKAEDVLVPQIAATEEKAKSSMDAWKNAQDKTEMAGDIFKISVAQKPDEAAYEYGKQKAQAWLENEATEYIGKQAGDYLGKGMGQSAKDHLSEKYSGMGQTALQVTEILTADDPLEEGIEVLAKTGVREGARAVGTYFGGPVGGEAAAWAADTLIELVFDDALA